MPRHLARSLPVALAVALAPALACRSAGAAGPPAAPERGAGAPAASGIDPSIVDAKVKLCDDFYAYACGGWLQRTPLPPDKARWVRSFNEIDERNLVLLREIAEGDAAGRLDAADRYPRKVGDLYGACMDEAAVEANGRRDLAEAWRSVDAIADAESLARAVGVAHREGVFTVFRVASRQDAKDATQVIGSVVQGGLSLPDRDDYLREDAKAVALQRAYRAHLGRMLQLAGVPAARAAQEAEAIYALERRMAEAQWTRVEMRDPQRTYNRLDLPGLRRVAPRFAWSAYLEALGHPGLTTFSASTPRYLARVSELVDAVPLDTWRAYLRWRILATLARDRAVPKALVDEEFAFTRENLTGQKELEARWKHCVRLTDAALGEALGQAFVRRHFGAEAKARTGELVSRVEGAMGRDLDGVRWLDAATRARAREKLGAVVNKVGYPDAWRDYGAMQLDRGSFLRSDLAANAFEVNRDLSKIGKPLDRNEWRMPPPIVNAYYSPPLNEMVFPAGILQPPFYTPGAPDAVNHGAVGMVIGHELTHGFDDQGRQYDARGDLVDWWSPAVGAEFQRRAQCVADQFSGYVADPAVPDVMLNGKLTLGENIADLGGLRLSFAAYEASRAGKGPEAAVAGFTPEQAFFIAYAQSWCALQTPEFARVAARTDPHSPARWRVNGPLSNLAEFREAFACPEGSAMVRPAARRCEVW